MPKFDNENELELHQGGHFGFHAIPVDDLLATEYTLVTIIADHSGSTSGFQADMEKALKNVVESCKDSPRADNLLLRLIKFSDNHKEIHGFRPFNSIGLDEYDGILAPQGMTALYDATINGIEATATYGRKLLEEDYQVNGIVVVITDGEENKSTLGIKHVREAFAKAVQSESLESLVSILVGVNPQNSAAFLNNFKDEAGFTEYVELPDATPARLAKLAKFISQSISSQSQALGTGGPSKAIDPSVMF